MMPSATEFFRYLILVGTPKSGTTSLFRYLSDHPQICPANRKETYFFAREFDYQRVCRLEPTRQAFDTYFSHCIDPSHLRLEGTPYTLYVRGAARQINEMLPSAKVLLILRDPVTRLFSDYRFHKERQHPAAAGTFAEFIEIQREMETGALPDLLELGCYADHLQPFYETMGADRLLILFFEDLASEPSAEMHRLCERLVIDPEYYSHYGFETHNQTVNVRNPNLHRAYMRLELVAARMRSAVMGSPRMHQMFEAAMNRGKAFYRTLNNRPAAVKESIPTEVAADLTNYYRQSVQALADLIGRKPPWKSY